MTESRTEIIWGPSIKPLLADLRRRRNRAATALAGLKNQDGLYAAEIRGFVAIYDDMIEVVKRHDEAHRATLI